MSIVIDLDLDKYTEYNARLVVDKLYNLELLRKINRNLNDKISKMNKKIKQKKIKVSNLKNELNIIEIQYDVDLIFD